MSRHDVASREGPKKAKVMEEAMTSFRETSCFTSLPWSSTSSPFVLLVDTSRLERSLAHMVHDMLLIANDLVKVNSLKHCTLRLSTGL